MKTKIDGLLIQKTPYQDRHLIAQLLLRSGKRISVIFFGGQGGGKKMKVSGLELGHLVAMEISPGRSSQEMYSCKEWMASWAPEHIRYHHQAFWLMCFYLEVMKLLSAEDQLHDLNRESDDSQAGLFRVLSNALFRLDKKVEQNSFNLYDEWLIFLGKILIEQGVFPERKHCVLSGQEILAQNKLVLLSDRGGFAHSELAQSAEQAHTFGEAGSELWVHLGRIAHQKYAEIPDLNVSANYIVHALLDYLCFQLQWQKKQFKSLSLLN